MSLTTFFSGALSARHIVQLIELGKLPRIKTKEFPKNQTSLRDFILTRTDITRHLSSLNLSASKLVTTEKITIQEKRLETDGSNALFYVPSPDNDKKIVVLITHGMGHSPVHFHKLAMLLAKRGITCVCHSLPGHHGSTPLRRKEFTKFGIEDYSINNGKKLIELARLFQDKAVFAFGHSMGGCTSLRGITILDQFLPANVKGAILLSTTLNIETPLRLTRPVIRCFGSNIDKLVSHYPFGFSRKGAFHAFFNGEFYDGFTKRDLEYFYEGYQKESFFSGLNLLMSVTPFRLIPPLAFNFKVNIQALPVLNMMGEEDRLIPMKAGKDVGHLLTKLGSLVSNEIIPGAPHDSMLTHPEKIADHIINWLCIFF